MLGNISENEVRDKSPRLMIGKSATVEVVSKLSLPLIKTEVGDLVTCDEVTLPFDPKRVFYLYDIPAGESRGAHALIECHQILVAVSGSFDVRLNDGAQERVIALNQPTEGLHIPPSIWAAETNFSGGAICLVLTSHEYDEGDYIREWSDFLKFKR